jgi:ankyrin repeat protein
MTGMTQAFNAETGAGGYGSLMAALRKKDAAAVVAVLAGAQIDFEATDEHGWTPLRLAISEDVPECVEILLKAGAKAETPPLPFGKGTPLFYAVEQPRANPRIVSLLLEHGAQPDTFDPSDADDKPLLKAARNGSEAIVLLLLQHGADVNQTARNGDTAIHLAAKEGEAGTIRILAGHGADLNCRNTSWLDRTPLENAVYEHRREAYDTLVALGADPYSLSKNKASLLMAAALVGDTGIMSDLIARGCDPDFRTDQGHTALMWAAWSGKSATVRKLLDLGVDTEAADEKGQTAWQMAAERGNSHIIRMLDEHVEKTVRKGTEAKMAVRRPLNLRKG